MKLFYTLLFVTGIAVIGINQELVTNFQSKGSFEHSYLQSVDSINYLVNVDFSNQLSVYKVISKDSVRFLHSGQFENLYNNKIIKFKGSLMLFDIPGFFIAYDFIKDEIRKEPIPKDYFLYNWKFESDSSVYFVMKDNFSYNSNSKYFKYNFKTGISECDEFVFHALHKKDNYYIFEKHDGDDRLETYYLYDENTGVRDTLITDLTFWKFMRMYMGDKCVWYQDITGALCSFNYTTKEKNRYENISPRLGEINIVKKVGNNMIITNSGKKGFYLQIFDLTTKKNIHQIKSKFSYPVYQYELYNTKLVTNHYDDELVVIDINSGNYKSFKSLHTFSQFRNLEVVDNRYVFNIYGGDFNLIDLKNMTTIQLEGTKDVAFKYNCQYMRLSDNDYFVSLTNHEYNAGYTPLYHVDLNSKNYKGVSSEFLKSNSGLNLNSRLVSVYGEVVLSINDLYHISGTRVEKINNKPIFGNYFWTNHTLFKGDLYYFTPLGTDSIKIMKFDGTNKSMIASFPFKEKVNEIDQIVIIDKTLYFVINFGEFYRYSLDEHKLEKLSSHVFLFHSDREDRNFLFQFGKDIYYCDNLDWELYAIYDNSEPQYVIDNIVRTTPVIIVKDKIFVMLKTGIYEMKNKKLFPLLKYSYTTCELSMSVTQDEEHQYMLIPMFSDLSSAYFYDGNNLKKIYPGREIISFNELRNDIYRLGINYLFDCNKAKGIEEPEFPDNERLFDALLFENDTFLLTRTNKGNSNKINFYHSTGYFKNIDLIDSYLSTSNRGQNNFLSFGESGIYYIKDKLLYIDEKKKIHLIDNLIGNVFYTKMIANNGYVYFIAIDKLVGRQVVRMKAAEYTSLIDKEDKDSFDVDIYPNPAKDFIRIDAGFIGKEYKIYDIKGSKVRHGNISTKEINISSMIPGVYFVEVNSGYKRYISKFVKI